MKKLRFTKRKARKHSSLEAEFTRQATAKGLPFLFESETYEYIIRFKYTPDFKIGNNIFIETKGHFDTADRRKMKAFKQQYPDIKIYMLFGNSNNKISKGSKTTYAMWCKKQGIECADISDGIPSRWWKDKKGNPFANLTSGHRDQPHDRFRLGTVATKRRSKSDH